MAGLILPTIRTTQPQQAVGINWSNPLAKGLRSIVTNNGGTPYDFVNKVKLVATGTPNTAVTNQGLAASATASTDVYAATIPTIAIAGLSAITFFTLAKANAVITTRQRALRYSNNISGTIAAVDFSDGLSQALQCSVQTTSAVFRTETWTSGYAANTWYFVATTYNLASGNVDIYINGSRISAFTDSTIGNGIKADINQVFIANSASAAPFNGSVLVSGLYTKALSPTEIKSLSDNPWQIFAPQPRRLFIVPSVGGGIANISLAITTDNSLFSGSANVSPLTSCSINTALSTFNGVATSNPTVSLSISSSNSIFSGSSVASPLAAVTINTASTTFSGSVSSSAVASAAISLITSATSFSGSAHVSPTALLSINTGLASFAGTILSAPAVSATLATTNSIVAATITSSPRASLAVATAPAVITGTGTGTVVTLSLTSVDLTAIADAVWAHSSALVIENKLLEAWGRLGLDPSKPMVTGSTTITFGEIVMAMTSTSESVTVTRQ